jgi:hypothetical protein
LRRQNNPKRLEESRSADFSFAMPWKDWGSSWL